MATEEPRAPATEGELVYAIGDIHGRYDLLKSLLAAIIADHRQEAQAAPPAVVFCGDYIDRGPHSAEVIEALVQLSRRTDLQVCALRGNHEQAALDFIQDPEQGAAWLRFGGAQTLTSYGVLPPPDGAEGGALVAAREALLARMPAAHLHFLESLSLSLSLGDYFFVHAGVRPGVPLDLQVQDDLLWIREPFIGSKAPFEKVVVHGHSWLDDQPWLGERRIGLDTGAYTTGVLTAVRLGLGEPKFLQAKGRPSAVFDVAQPQ